MGRSASLVVGEGQITAVISCHVRYLTTPAAVKLISCLFWWDYKSLTWNVVKSCAFLCRNKWMQFSQEVPWYLFFPLIVDSSFQLFLDICVFIDYLNVRNARSDIWSTISGLLEWVEDFCLFVFFTSFCRLAYLNNLVIGLKTERKSWVSARRSDLMWDRYKISFVSTKCICVLLKSCCFGGKRN